MAKKKVKLAQRKARKVIDSQPDLSGKLNDDEELCLECFWGPADEALSCDKNLGHQGNHLCFLPYLGYDGIMFEWPDEAWDEWD